MPSPWPRRDLSGSFRTSRFCSDGGCVGIAAVGEDGAVLIADTKAPGPVLRLGRDEWRAFVIHAKGGGFDRL